MSRFVTAVTLCTFLCGVAGASELQLSSPVLALDHAAHRAKISRDVGLALTIAGTLFTVFGSLGICIGDADCRGVYGNTSWSSQLASIVVVGVGQSMIVPGIVLWSSGQKNADDAQKKRLELGAGGVRLVF